MISAGAIRKSALGLSVAASIAVTVLIQPWEKRVYLPYPDIGGVWTVCDGHTGPDIIIGKTYTDPECDALTAKDTSQKEAVVDRGLKGPVPDFTKAAFISFAYNVGEKAFLNSTLLRRANAGDLVGACNQLSRWVYVKGVIIRGLVNRRYKGDGHRISERSLCMLGLDPNYREPLLEKLIAKYAA